MTDLPPLISSADAAKLLGVSRKHVDKLRSEGKLKPARINPQTGHAQYARSDVEALAHLRESRRKTPLPAVVAPVWTVQQCKDAFAMFRQGKTLPEIVEACDLTPQQVRELHAQYVTPLGAAPAPPRPIEVDPIAQQREDRARSRRLEEEERERLRQAAEVDRTFERELREIDEQRRALQSATEEATRTLESAPPLTVPREALPSVKKASR